MSRQFLVPLVLPADPTIALEAATKQYVDAKTNGSMFYEWMFSTSTTTPPSASEIRLNNATPSAATKVYIRGTTYDGVDVRARMLVQAVAGSQFYVQDKDNSANYYVYNVVSDGIDQTTYVELTVTYDSGAGTVPAQRVVAGLINTQSGGAAATGTKLTALSALTGAGAATTDIVEVVDISDTTMAASGTNKKITLAELVIFLNANGITVVAASETVAGKVELATAAETLTGTDNTRAVHPAGVIPLANSGPLFGFLFDTTTTAGSVTSGLRLNNATPASATIVYINYTSRSGVDLKTRIMAGTAGDRLFIQDRVNSAVYRIYELTAAPTDNTTYATVPVVHRGGAGALWANGLSIVAGFTPPPITVSNTAPTSPLTNDIWIDTT